MSLGDSQLQRYARQVIIPGLGAEGQQRLLDARALVIGPARERDIAADYLARAGVGLADADDEHVDCIVACAVTTLTDTERAALEPHRCPIVWYSLNGRILLAGTLLRFDASAIDRIGYTDETTHPALASLAACDAAASAISILLGWSSSTNQRKWRFA
jgi:hypothetical protein